jgi:hypothetical protein
MMDAFCELPTDCFNSCNKRTLGDIEAPPFSNKEQYLDGLPNTQSCRYYFAKESHFDANSCPKADLSSSVCGSAVESPNKAGVFGSGEEADVVIWLVIMLFMVAVALLLQQLYLRRRAAAASRQEQDNDIEMAAKAEDVESRNLSGEQSSSEVATVYDPAQEKLRGHKKKRPSVWESRPTGESCDECGNLATVVCKECDQILCDEHDQFYHRKGQRKLHTRSPLFDGQPGVVDDGESTRG